MNTWRPMSNRRSVSIRLVLRAKYSSHVYYIQTRLDGNRSIDRSMRMNDQVHCQLKPYYTHFWCMKIIVSMMYTWFWIFDSFSLLRAHAHNSDSYFDWLLIEPSHRSKINSMEFLKSSSSYIHIHAYTNTYDLRCQFERIEFCCKRISNQWDDWQNFFLV